MAPPMPMEAEVLGEQNERETIAKIALLPSFDGKKWRGRGRKKCANNISFSLPFDRHFLLHPFWPRETVNAQHNGSKQHSLDTTCCVELKCAQKVQHNRRTQQYTNDHTGLARLYELPRLREITICILLESRHEILAT